MSGRLRQKSYLLIRFCPIGVELSLVDTMTDPIIDVSTAPHGVIAANVLPFLLDSYIHRKEIVNAQTNSDIFTFDSGFEEEF